MENQSGSLISYVPSFARGCTILVIHDDKVSLIYLSSLLEQYSFKVDIVEDTSAAASMICDNEGMFKLIMAKATMPNMDILGSVIEKDTPVILIGGSDNDVITRDALALQACYFLEEPIRLDDLKYKWENVFRSAKAFSQKEETDDHQDANGGKLKENRRSEVVVDIDNKHYTRQPAAAAVDTDGRRFWNAQLHRKFTQAVRLLGGVKVAHPKWILSLMNEPDLTVHQVASHLQKYKLGLMQRRKEKATKKILAPTSTPSKSSNKASLGTKEPCACMKKERRNNEMKYGESEVTATLEIPNPNNNGGQQQQLQSVDCMMEVQMDEEKQPATNQFDDLLNMLVLNCDTCDWLGSGVNPDEVDQYCEMLKTVLDGKTDPSNCSS